MRRREQIGMLRRLSLTSKDTEEAKALRVLANELENELAKHAEAERKSYQRRKDMDDA
jgi:hypothetical protein